MDQHMSELLRLMAVEGLTPDARFSERLQRFEALLLEKNKVMNLTAITDPAEMEKKHYWDSLYPLFRGVFSADARLVDVGCGAGFPSVPLKLAAPQLQFVLLDSLQKRLRFLDEVIAALDLTGIRTLHLRAEDAGREPSLREQFDGAVSRAVAELPKLCEYCLPLVKPGGIFVAYKGAAAAEEQSKAVEALSLLGGKVERVYHYALPGEEDRRALIVIRKTRPTPDAYPRAQKWIKEKPL